MIGHEEEKPLEQPYKYTYHDLADIEARAKELGVALPLARDTAVLGTPLLVGNTYVANRMGVAPMEGVDSLPDGTPGELTVRRYERFARGGSGVIWFEAVSVVQEGRSSLQQLLITRDNLDAYKRLCEGMKEAGLKANGYAPYLIMQANHSGRYSRPNAETRPEPIVAFHNPYIEKDAPLPESCIATDDYLKALEEKFGEGAQLAKEAGFDAVDIKSCHGYLFAELAAAHTRKGPYGGSFDNRMRCLFNSVKNAKRAESPDFRVVARLSFFDNIPYPYGFGMAKDGSLTVDMAEPLEMVRVLHQQLGISFVNMTVGDPHYEAYQTRPFNLDIKFAAREDPLVSVARVFKGAAEVKARFPELAVSCSAASYLRSFAPNLAAGAIQSGMCDHVLFGRLAFANPDFPKDVLQNGCLTVKQSCAACSKCSELIRAGVPTGCVLHDSETYMPIYKKLHAGV